MTASPAVRDRFCAVCHVLDDACACTARPAWEPGATGVQQAGIDTWSPAWRVDRDSASGAWLDAMATVPAARGRLLPQPIGGHRVGWNRQANMLYAEGHPATGRLGAPDELPDALRALVAAMGEADVPMPDGRAATDLYGDRFDGFLGIRRLDVTADWVSKTESEGLAVMAGCAALAQDWPRGMGVLHSKRGRVETVAIHGYGGKNMVGRVYDKGVESGLAPAGRLLRPEDQRRFRGETRRAPEELTAAFVRGKFRQRFQPLWRASKGVTVAGPLVIAERMQEFVESGELSEAAAAAVAGDLLMELAPPRKGQLISRATRYRRKAQRRDLGLVLANDLLGEVEVDLHGVLEEVMEAEAWGLSGPEG